MEARPNRPINESEYREVTLLPEVIQRVFTGMPCGREGCNGHFVTFYSPGNKDEPLKVACHECRDKLDLTSVKISYNLK